VLKNVFQLSKCPEFTSAEMPRGARQYPLGGHSDL
jgi:hypothetical protein